MEDIERGAGAPLRGLLPIRGLGENLRDKPKVMLGGRVGKDIKKAEWRVINSRDKPKVMLGGRVGKDIKKVGWRDINSRDKPWILRGRRVGIDNKRKRSGG